MALDLLHLLVEVALPLVAAGAEAAQVGHQDMAALVHHQMVHNEALRDASREVLTVSAITVRNLPPKVAKAIRDKARKERLSLNKAVIKLLEEATGATQGTRKVVHHDLDHMAGTWSQAEYDEFMESLREQRQIDPEMWK